MGMSGGMPPPLPPKQRGSFTAADSSNASNNNNAARYTSEDVVRALQEEDLEYERIKQQRARGAASLRLGMFYLLTFFEFTDKVLIIFIIMLSAHLFFFVIF